MMTDEQAEVLLRAVDELTAKVNTLMALNCAIVQIAGPLIGTKRARAMGIRIPPELAALLEAAA